MDQEEKEQQARIALLDYFGSLARHWATVLLATVVAFYSVWQIRKYLDNWVFTFALTMTVAGAVYAFLRMVTHGKYCELALDNKVRPLEKGTHVTRMLHGMHRNLGKSRCGFLDKLGDFGGFVCWTLISVCAWFVLASLWTLGYLKWLVDALEKWLMGALQYRLWGVPATPLVAAVLILVFIFGITKISPKIYKNEVETAEPPER